MDEARRPTQLATTSESLPQTKGRPSCLARTPRWEKCGRWERRVTPRRWGPAERGSWGRLHRMGVCLQGGGEGWGVTDEDWRG